MTSSKHAKHPKKETGGATSKAATRPQPHNQRMSPSPHDQHVNRSPHGQRMSPSPHGQHVNPKGHSPEADEKQILDNFRNPKLAEKLLTYIQAQSSLNATLMEVCGTHTMAIAKYGLRNLMPKGIKLVSGPGCPVCVTSNKDIDTIIALCKIPHVIIATFGDMIRVPGSSSSLIAQQANGIDIRIVYSPLDALQLAQENPKHTVVFIGIGFETTTPLVAQTIMRAKALHVHNFCVYSAHKNMPNALEQLISDPYLQVDAFILPGHVSTIIGSGPYQFLSKNHHIPGVITGFDPVDILQGIAMILQQLQSGNARIEIAYTRGVMPEGNPVALSAINTVFETCPAIWRGLGEIAGSGYKIRSNYAEYDALVRFNPEVEETHEPAGCQCGNVLRARLTPPECPLFRTLCTPENPLGPCMVSSEGTCAAYYKYYKNE